MTGLGQDRANQRPVGPGFDSRWAHPAEAPARAGAFAYPGTSGAVFAGDVMRGIAWKVAATCPYNLLRLLALGRYGPALFHP